MLSITGITTRTQQARVLTHIYG